MTLLVHNCRLHTAAPGDAFSSVFVEGGKIQGIGAAESLPRAARVIDAEGRLLIPGLIDIHLHGAGGADVHDGTAESLVTIAAALARTGVTSYVGTTMAWPEEGNRHLHVAREAVRKDLGGAELLGIHLEGPFVNTAKKGGLDPAGIYESSDAARRGRRAAGSAGRGSAHR